MPFVKINTSEHIRHLCDESPAFKNAWETNEEVYRLIDEMIAIRKKSKVTRKSLARSIHKPKRMISEIERGERIPSLRIFCAILNTLGYRLEIVKK